MSLLSRVLKLEDQIGAQSSIKPIFLVVVDSSVPDPDNPAPYRPMTDADLLGFKAGPSSQGPELRVMRKPGETEDELRQRCAQVGPQYIIWFGIYRTVHTT